MPEFRRSSSILLLCTLFAVGLADAATVGFQTTALPGGLPGRPLFEYTYFLSGFNFLANEELDIMFPASEFGTLSNGVTTPGFDLELFQPNTPGGAPGDFSALALSNLGSVTGPWGVEVAYVGSGQPGSQPFSINQYDAHGVLIGDPIAGRTQEDPVPEPDTLFQGSCAVVLGGCFWWASLRRRTRRPGHATLTCVSTEQKY